MRYVNDWADLRVGTTYLVKLDDCCIAGEFTSMLTDIELDDEYPKTLEFENGVKLTNVQGVAMHEIDDDDAPPIPPIIFLQGDCLL